MHFSTALLLVLGTLVDHGIATWGIKYFDNLVAFGDSYTDESRLGWYFKYGSAPPPGTTLAASNTTAGGGITWARWVSTYTGARLYNYAISGAVCDNRIIYRIVSSALGPFPDVIDETTSYIADANYINSSTGTNTFYNNRQADNTVYSIWIGTNDLGEGAFLTDSSLNGTTIPDYVDCVFDRLDEIYATGARYFVLMNAIPLELSPLYGMPGVPGTLTVSKYWKNKPANITEVSGKMKEYTHLVNSLFEYRTPFEVKLKHRYPHASIALFDTHALVSDIYYNPEQYLDSPANATGQYHLCDAATGSSCTNDAGSKLNQWLWYDELHPSERVDEVVAKEFVRVVGGNSTYATYW